MRRVAGPMLFATLALALLSPSVFAQTSSREPADFRHATTLGVFGGGSVDGEHAGPAAGAALGWQLSPAVGIEGTARWFARGRNSDAFSGALLVQSDVLSRRGANLFVSGGLGVYHVSFDHPGESALPGFYRRRMAERKGPASTASFTDPAVVLGGGLRFALTRHLSVRPALDSTIVPVRGRYHVVTMFAVAFAYRFEHHPVTAVRGSQ